MNRRPVFLVTVMCFGFAFFYVPILSMMIFSFNDSRLNAEWVGFTWHWYEVLLNDEEMIQAALNSIFIALGASLIATVLGIIPIAALLLAWFAVTAGKDAEPPFAAVVNLAARAGVRPSARNASTCSALRSRQWPS